MKERETKFDIIAEYYQSHYVELIAFVGKRIDYTDEVEDIVQNIFVRLLLSDKMISEITLPCLVYTVARNLIYDFWRHHRLINEYEHYFKSTTSCGNNDTLSIYSANEINQILEKGIALLSDKKRHIYKMCIYDGMKVSEISKTLGENYKRVENYLGAARKEVRQYVDKMLA
ncbi:MAG TPA: RNA polymerase sigma factor [Thomasclavelia ramosa]|nr:RNA polymerase sigma factor [Thomasclavelia ramosa]